MTSNRDYMAPMPSDPELKRLDWRAHHRGTKEADLMIGGFFDAHQETWGSDERTLFAAMLEEQDGDIISWALGTPDPPGHFPGPMIEALQRLDYNRVQR